MLKKKMKNKQTIIINLQCMMRYKVEGFNHWKTFAYNIKK